MGDGPRSVRKRKRKVSKLALSYKKRRKNKSHHCAKWNEQKPDFSCAVAVWIHNFLPMTNEMTAQLNLRALEFRCISRCYLHRSGTLHKAAIFLFPHPGTAAAFCEATPLHDDGLHPPFKTSLISSFLADVSRIEGNTSTYPSTAASVVFRNLPASPPAIQRDVVRLSALFGNVSKCRCYKDVRGETAEFRHVVVTYANAAQAFAAQIGLDGKWMKEMEYHLQVEVLREGVAKYVMEELFKENKMIFQP